MLNDSYPVVIKHEIWSPTQKSGWAASRLYANHLQSSNFANVRFYLYYTSRGPGAAAANEQLPSQVKLWLQLPNCWSCPWSLA